jgi:conjugative relaxase-like TrwC/TraI family protein
VLRVTTLYASSAVATAAYYTRYLAAAPGEEPGVWLGAQAAGLGLDGRVDADELQLLLEGRDPQSGTSLGLPLRDRTLASGTVVRAVAGFDATFSAPKSVSVWRALSGDPGVLDAHDVAVRAALEHLERFGATTRVRVNGARQYREAVGLTVAAFRQTTSRADDPQVHTHAVISAKVQTADGRWMALDARYLKRYQRMLGGLYQSVLRAELTHRYGVGWEPIVNGQAEIAGTPGQLLEVFSKRTGQVDAALAAKVAEFHAREGRDPTRWERAALCREASADTRAHKTGHGVVDLRARWQAEAAEVGWTARRLHAEVGAAGRRRMEPEPLTVEAVVDRLSVSGSTWTRADVLRAICDQQPTVSSMDGHRWAAWLERACDRVIESCVDLDPPGAPARRSSDGRSVWLEPTAAHLTSDTIVAEEEAVLAWAMDAQSHPAAPSPTVDGAGLDVMQAHAAAAVAGGDRLVVVVGPAGAGKTTMLQRAVADLVASGRSVFGLAPTAKAARVLEAGTGVHADTVAKLLHERGRADRPPFEDYRWPLGTTVIIDEAGMTGTSSLYQLVHLAEHERWRLVLVGDPRQLQAVGRGGLFDELCASSRVHELIGIHRFIEPWEADASRQLRAGEPDAFDAYEAHGRIVAGTFVDHVERIAREWAGLSGEGKAVAVTAATNDHVDAVNAAVQRLRLGLGELRPDGRVRIGGGEHAYSGDVVVTRRNDRELRTSTGEPVRNRDLWGVVATHGDGSLAVSHRAGHGELRLPADYVRQHVRLGYAATEHGNQGDTVDVGIQLVSTATTHRGLYVGATRGRQDNQFYVVTPTPDPAAARDVLDMVLALDRADIPAVTQRRTLAIQQPRTSEPSPQFHDAIPEWLAPYRASLVDRRDHLFDRLRRRDDERAVAAAELAALQPTLHAARAAWQPHADRIAALERQVHGELRPIMWRANSEAMHASFGHRHATSRRAREATSRVNATQARIAEIRAEGASVKEALDALEDRARHLVDVCNAAFSSSLDQLDHLELDGIDRVVASLDTWTAWGNGRPVALTQLAAAVETLTEHARHSVLFVERPGDVGRDHWMELLGPVTQLLVDQGIEIDSGRGIDVESAGVELGIDL